MLIASLSVYEHCKDNIKDHGSPSQLATIWKQFLEELNYAPIVKASNQLYNKEMFIFVLEELNYAPIVKASNQLYNKEMFIYFQRWR